MEFKSQICTTREQSQKLLALGLKKETADMVWMKELAWDEVAHCTYDAETYMLRPIDYLEGESHRRHILAWSLHRLIELCGRTVYDWMSEGNNPYEDAINCLELLIKNDCYNKDYLEEKK